MTQPISNNVYSQGSGTTSSNPFVILFMTRDPTSGDINYPVQKLWVNKNTATLWTLANLYSVNGVQQANWLDLSTGGGTGIISLEGNSGGKVFGDGSANVNVVGDGTTIDIVGNPGSHTLTASLIGSTFAMNVQVFTSTADYTPTMGLQYAMVECVGAGGGAGGASASISNTVTCGGGGGAGGYCRKLFTAAQIGAGQVVLIGVGGIGGAGAASGLSGTSTQFGSLLTANGGSPGSGGAVGGICVSGGGFGGAASGGDFNFQGQSGQTSLGWVNDFFSLCVGYGGAGGNSIYGSGGESIVGTNNSNSTGYTGHNYGSGGSGAICMNGSAGDQTGGAGSNGIVIVTEFI